MHVSWATHVKFGVFANLLGQNHSLVLPFGPSFLPDHVLDAHVFILLD
jgi:hypothetical protein